MPVAPRLSFDEQWGRVEAHVARTLAAASHAAELQTRAADQLDAADYAMLKLHAELAGVMSIASANRRTSRKSDLAPRQPRLEALPLAA